MLAGTSVALVIAALGAGVYGEVDPTPPDTAFIKTPGKRLVTTKRTVAVEFSFLSNQARSRFECAREGAVFEPCSSPLAYRVGPGWHFIMVRAIDPAGNADLSPDDYLFKVRRKRRE